MDSLLGSCLRDLRVARGFSQATLAAKCASVEGITQTTISRWERGGRCQPSAGQLEALLRALGATDADRIDALRIAGEAAGLPEQRLGA